MPPVRDWPRPRCNRPSFQAGCRGADPPGRAGLRVHSSCRGRRGAGSGARRRETDPVCLSETQSTVHKGGLRGVKGLPGARLIPTPARGLGEECRRRIPPLGPAGECLPHPGWVRSSAAPHPGGGGQGKPPRRGKSGWTSEGATHSNLLH